MLASLDKVFCIILAAGNSSRMGQPKQLLPWKGDTLLGHAINSVCPLLGSRIIVVLGANADAICATVELSQVTVVDNPYWQEGMASSIRVGVAGLPPDATAVLALLCDQPLIASSQLNGLLAEWQKRPESIIAASYGGTVGVPAVFPSGFLGELSALSGDAGAKSLFSKHPDKLVTVSLPEAILDIDTLANYNQLQSLTNPISSGSKP